MISSQLEIDNVKNIYNTIGEHFNITRAYLWNSVKQFINGIAPYSIMLEVGG